jgi:uncharacterized peroxidase-related enzyme
MHRITPLTKDAVPELAEGFARIEAILGFIPNSNLIMARHPALLRSFQQLAVAALAPGKVPQDLKIMIAHMTSRAAGCSYCIAHTGHIAEKNGVTDAKLTAIWDYEKSDLFSQAERSALTLARGAAMVPNAVTDADSSELKKHFSEDQIVEMIGVIALYGFLNRWNDTLATELERDPLQFGKAHLGSTGWDVGKHGAR